MSNAETAGSAFDASVYTENREVTSVRELKAASAVEYLDRELAKANETVERLEEKVNKMQERLDDAKAARDEAKRACDQFTSDLERARHQRDELGGEAES